MNNMVIDITDIFWLGYTSWLSTNELNNTFGPSILFDNSYFQGFIGLDILL